MVLKCRYCGKDVVLETEYIGHEWFQDQGECECGTEVYFDDDGQYQIRFGVVLY